MEPLQETPPSPGSPPEARTEKRPYEAPKVEAVQLSKEAAESLT